MKSNCTNVSIIIPIYKVEEYVVECLRSVVAQSVNLELVLVDDCGGDQSVQKAIDYLEKESGMPVEAWRVLTHKQNRGLSAARNTGLNAARGEYIYFLDSDDTLPDKALELLWNKAQETQAQVVVGHTDLMVGEVWKHNLSDASVLNGEETLDRYLARDWHEIACNKLVSRSFILEHKLFFKEGIIHEDEVWTLTLACLRPTLAAVCAPTYLYRNEREDSIINTARRKNLLHGSYALMNVMQLCTQIGVRYGLLSRASFQNHLQTWVLVLIFVNPELLKLNWRAKWRYFAQFARCSESALIKSYGLPMDWRFRALALISILPSTIASPLLQLFVAFWKLRPGGRARNFINNSTNTSA